MVLMVVTGLNVVLGSLARITVVIHLASDSRVGLQPSYVAPHPSLIQSQGKGGNLVVRSFAFSAGGRRYCT